jgi:surfactin synthase thioesterase subunit
MRAVCFAHAGRDPNAFRDWASHVTGIVRCVLTGTTHPRGKASDD